MMHRIIEVKPLENFVVYVVFQNGTIKEYDVKKLFDIFPQFQKFNGNRELFEQVKVDMGGYGVSWNDELDLDAEEIWDGGILLGQTQNVDIKLNIGYKLAAARKSVGMTQKELCEKVHMYQADISKIERGSANPSIQTLQKLAEGMGMKLRIEFVE